MVLVGIGKFCFVSPITYSTTVAPPEVVPTPTDCGALKYTKSLIFDSNFFVLTGILILLFKTSTFDPNV